jgi:hypothetical protein
VSGDHEQRRVYSAALVHQHVRSTPSESLGHRLVLSWYIAIPVGVTVVGNHKAFIG